MTDNHPELRASISEAADVIRSAEALLIGAGAGMGVDSGLPDFRGPEGFWRAYPLFRESGRQFQDVSNPRTFREDISLAWGFYGHRMNLYRATRPHSGFKILRKWAEQMPLGGFVYTSNVDGHFQRTGFDEKQVMECHGSLNFLQCRGACERFIFPADEVRIEVDEETLLAHDPLPQCPQCGASARPNVLMFYDSQWCSDRTDRQEACFETWARSVIGKRVAIVELGCGTAIPTVRMQCEHIAQMPKARMIRINPREPECLGEVSIGLGALDALQRIDSVLEG